MAAQPFIEARLAELLERIVLTNNEMREMRCLQDRETLHHWDVDTVRIVTDKRGLRVGIAHIFKVYGRAHEVEDILRQLPEFVARRRLIWRIIPTRAPLPRAAREVEPPSTLAA